MTIAWGAACVDGVVLITDSMVKRDGGSHAELGGQKIGWIGRRVAFVASGTFRDLDGLLARRAGVDPSPSVVEALPQLLGDIALRFVPDADATEGGYSSYVLIGGGHAGACSALLWVRLDPLRIVSVPIGSTVQGWSYGRGIRRVDRKLTTEVAVGLGIAECRATIRQAYRPYGKERLGDFFRDPAGLIPATALPLHVAVITDDETCRYEVAVPGDLTQADLDASVLTRRPG